MTVTIAPTGQSDTFIFTNGGFSYDYVAPSSGTYTFTFSALSPYQVSPFCTPVPPPSTGTLQLVKRTTGGDGTFGFTSAALSNPSLTTSSGTAQTTIASVAPGTYTITEAAAAGWDLTSIACTGNATPATVNVASRNVSVPVAANENVVCTFNNTLQTGTLQLVKRTVGGDGTFSFTSLELSNPSLTTISGTAQTTAATVTPGTYTIVEAATAGWDLTSVVCTGNASAATVSLPSRVLNVPVAANENVVCTFNNTKQTGTLQLFKRTVGGDGTFSFTSVELGNPSLTTVAGVAQTAVTTLAAGTYSITEAAAAGWDLTSIGCSGSATPATINVASRNVSVTVNGNETVICTFNNRRQTGTLQLAKRTTGGEGTFPFTSAILGNPSLTTVSGAAQTPVTTVDAGIYTITEAAALGWDLASIGCSGSATPATVNVAARTVSVTVNANETVLCTFNNARQTGTLRLVKATTGGDGTFSFTSPELSNPSLTTVSGTAQTAVTTVASGTYTITESAVSGWTLTGASCTGGATAATFNAGTRSVSVPVAANESVVCTFNNTLQTGTLQLVKQTVGGDGTFGFTTTAPGLGNPSISTSGGAGQTAAAVINPGTYTLTEAAAAGWDLTSIACTGGSTPATVSMSTRSVSVPVAANDNVVCTFRNSQQGSLTLRKMTVGGDGSFSFTSTAPGLSAVTLATSGGAASRTVSPLSAGTYSITEATADGWTLSGIACSGGTSTVDLAGRTVSVTVAAGQNATCTFTNTEVGRRTEKIVRDFITRRGERIVTNGPSEDRLIDRLSDEEPQPERQGSLKDDYHTPMKLGSNSAGVGERRERETGAEPAGRDTGIRVGGSGNDEAGRVNFAGSLSSMRKAAQSQEQEKMRLGGLPSNTSKQPLFDMWVQGVYEYLDFGKAMSSGNFGLVMMGIDYKLAPGMLLGVMVQYDTMSEKSDQLGYSVKGHGWMAGPYAAMRLSKHLFLDGRLLYGKSTNEISPYLTYTDEFTTSRWLAAARLSGRWNHGNWQFQPSAEVVYYVDKSDEYVDSNGFTIGSQEAKIGRVLVGPKVSYTMRRDDGVLAPYVALKGIWDFEKPEATPINGVAFETSDVHARIEAGIAMKWHNGVSVDIGAAYEGFASDKASSTAVRGSVKIPLR